ncbi:hypothetical protein LAZ67_2000722 [Cordylochernes scorpioides]|uniref:Transposase n=1 Tax=Cordylochernes scorpioides TaxID=51811 RepID=A0ABY6K0P3_9ARAC|nr:hypothetical protein LAZ67_2000722 [Cordylochernes scorpioides]
MDQRTCIKFCVKNEIKCADAFRMLTELPWTEATFIGERAGRPSTSTTDEKINEVEKMILANRRITVREVAEDLNISIGSCHSIFINDLGMRRVAAKFVPKLLNCDQKQHRMNIANEMLDSVRDDPNLLQRVITGDEAGVVHHEFLPQSRTVNKEYYLQVIRHLREAIRQKRPDLWKNKNWLLHHDNAPAHTSLLVRDFLAKNNTLMMPQPPYSPDLAPCDFFLFPKLKRPMKGRRYATLDEIKTASKEELKKIIKNDFFEDWKNRWHKCIISHGDYFEGDKIAREYEPPHQARRVTFGKQILFEEFEDTEEPELLNSKTWKKIDEGSFFIKDSKHFNFPTCSPPSPKNCQTSIKKPPNEVKKMLQEVAIWMEEYQKPQARRLADKQAKKKEASYSAAYLIRVIAILLIIGGVELNPGPPTKKQTTLSTVRTPETKEVMEDDLKSIVIQIHTELRTLGARLETRLQSIEQKFDEWDQRLTVIETSQKTCLELATKNDLRIKSLEDHGDMLDRKTRENNLIFYGIIGPEAENSDETLCKVVTAINENMQIQIESEIMRCRRLSKKANAPILVEIPKQTTRIALLRNAYKFRVDKIFVNKDYTLKTREQRRLLITKKKELSEKGIHSKLRDNKLLANGQKYEVVDGRVVGEKG